MSQFSEHVPSLPEALGWCPVLNYPGAKLRKCNPHFWKVEDVPQGYLWIHSKLGKNLNLFSKDQNETNKKKLSLQMYHFAHRSNCAYTWVISPPPSLDSDLTLLSLQIKVQWVLRTVWPDSRPPCRLPPQTGGSDSLCLSTSHCMKGSSLLLFWWPWESGFGFSS